MMTVKAEASMIPDIIKMMKYGRREYIMIL